MRLQVVPILVLDSREEPGRTAGTCGRDQQHVGPASRNTPWKKPNMAEKSTAEGSAFAVGFRACGSGCGELNCVGIG